MSDIKVGTRVRIVSTYLTLCSGKTGTVIEDAERMKNGGAFPYLVKLDAPAENGLESAVCNADELEALPQFVIISAAYDDDNDTRATQAYSEGFFATVEDATQASHDIVDYIERIRPDVHVRLFRLSDGEEVEWTEEVDSM